MIYDRAAMKEEVKQAMKQTRPHPMLVTLLLLVVVGAGSSLISWGVGALFSGGMPLEDLLFGIMVNGEDYLEAMLNSAPELLVRIILMSASAAAVTGILSTVWSGLMNAGYAGYCLDMSQSANPDLERIFGGFSRAGSVIPACVLVAVFTFLWGLLFGLGLGVLLGIAFVIGAASDSLAIFGVLLMAAATVGYIAAMIWVTFRYAMVPFAVMDSRNSLSAMDAINTSKALMKGRMGSYFVLQISFIGWYLLELLIVLVGIIISWISFFVAASSFITGLSYDEYMAILAGNYDYVWLALRLLGPVLAVALVCGVGIFIFELWLTPYHTGCNARFYAYATGSTQPIPPGPSGGQPPIQPYAEPEEPGSGTPQQPGGPGYPQ